MKLAKHIGNAEDRGALLPLVVDFVAKNVSKTSLHLYTELVFSNPETRTVFVNYLKAVGGDGNPPRQKGPKGRLVETRLNRPYVAFSALRPDHDGITDLTLPWFLWPRPDAER